MKTMMTRKRINGLAASMLGSLLALTLTGLPGCKQEAASTPAHPAPEVQVVTVSPQTISDEPEFIG